MADNLVSPSRITGPEVSELLDHYWDGMRRTRRNAEDAARVIAGTDVFVLPETFVIAGADQYVASIPHPRTVPQRVLQKTIARRPHLGIPLGPKGLGLTAQRQTTRVEEPLNAICEDKRVGFQWERMCGLLLFEGWGASITVTDPSDWLKHPSAWEDEKSQTWAKKYRVDDAGRAESHDNYSGTVDDGRARRLHEMDLSIHRARNVPIRHRAIGIRNAAPIFGPDLSVEGLIVSQEFSTSWLKRHYDFGDTGVATPTGGSSESSGQGRISGTGRTLTLIEAWLYDEDGLPYVSYCIRGGHAIEAYWKGSNDLATIDLHDRFGLDRLPVDWAFGLGNPAETNPDLRAMGFLEPFSQGWNSVRAKMTANNVAILFGSYPILMEEPLSPMANVGTLEDDEPTKPDIVPMKIVSSRPGTKLSQLKIDPVNDSSFRQIELELGANAEETPGKANKDQSGFSQSMAEAFEELALTTVHDALGRLYESHGSFVLEAGKRLPGLGKRQGEVEYAPIMVFASTDVPLSENSDKHNEPMELDPDLIDETFTCVSRYVKSMSIPETQQSMEEVARNLKTRRKHLEDTGDDTPEETELELMLEAIRAEPAYKQYAIKLMAKVQGSEELAEITQNQQDGLANDQGAPAGWNAGVAPAVPGMPAPMVPGAPGVPVDGSVTGMGGTSYGQAALAGTVGGAGMTGPINNAVQAGGVVPATLPGPGVGV